MRPLVSGSLPHRRRRLGQIHATTLAVCVVARVWRGAGGGDLSAWLGLGATVLVLVPAGTGCTQQCLSQQVAFGLVSNLRRVRARGSLRGAGAGLGSTASASTPYYL